MGENVITVNDIDFNKEVLESKAVVVVEFFATWCSPCKMQAPIFYEVSRELSGKAKFVKINIDESEKLAIKYKVDSIPCTILFVNGEEKNRLSGLVTKSALCELIIKYI